MNNRGTVLLLAVLAMAGCMSIGPDLMNRDRFDYSNAVAESWKTQMLLNLVKLRYDDTPIFMDVSSVVAGYSATGAVGASASIPTFQGNPNTGTVTGTYGATVGGTFANNPTISMVPLTGERFARAMMHPIPPVAILSVVQSGLPVEVVFRLAVQAVNGVDNRRVQRFHVQPAEPEFYALLQELRRIQNSGDIGMRLDDKQLGHLVFRPGLTAAVEGARLRVAKILNLDPAAREYRLVYGVVAANDKEIALLTRSIYEVLNDLSTLVVVPEEHVAQRRVGRTPLPDLGPDGPIPPLLRIVSSAERPGDAFVAAPYRGYWFSIDDRDIPSKQLFSFLMFLFTFVETSGTAGAPVLTIPVR